jgi:hypothetical protein
LLAPLRGVLEPPQKDISKQIYVAQEYYIHPHLIIFAIPSSNAILKLQK